MSLKGCKDRLVVATGQHQHTNARFKKWESKSKSKSKNKRTVRKNGGEKGVGPCQMSSRCTGSWSGVTGGHRTWIIETSVDNSSRPTSGFGCLRGAGVNCQTGPANNPCAMRTLVKLPPGRRSRLCPEPRHDKNGFKTRERREFA